MSNKLAAGKVAAVVAGLFFGFAREQRNRAGRICQRGSSLRNEIENWEFVIGSDATFNEAFLDAQ
ncbi:MAG: hypothetical protein L0Z50_20370 [Verrucomicrobiales bacterium]|nr:hypothetical protein [Verrucomicrobiales bacterium]